MTTTEHNTPPRRSRLLLVLIAFLVIFQAGAALRIVQLPGGLAAQISLRPPLEFTASVLWAILAVLVFRLLWIRRPNANIHALSLLVVFSIYSLLRLLLFAQADYDRRRLGFLTIVITFLTAFVAIRSFLFSRRHPTEMIKK